MHTPTSYNKLLGAVKYTQNSKFSFKLLGGGRYGERQTGLKFFKSKVVQNISLPKPVSFFKTRTPMTKTCNGTEKMEHEMQAIKSLTQINNSIL